MLRGVLINRNIMLLSDVQKRKKMGFDKVKILCSLLAPTQTGRGILHNPTQTHLSRRNILCHRHTISGGDRELNRT